MKKLSFFFLLIILLNSCGFKEAGQVLRNEKIRTTDEFLVKKREPLVLPPDYENVPKPGTTSQAKENEEEKIKKILKVPEKETSNTKNQNSIEKSILDKIKKWKIFPLKIQYKKSILIKINQKV